MIYRPRGRSEKVMFYFSWDKILFDKKFRNDENSSKQIDSWITVLANALQIIIIIIVESLPTFTYFLQVD